ncbi:MAG: HD domain-containing phosphohydrolase [Gaiellales bacterium]
MVRTSVSDLSAALGSARREATSAAIRLLRLADLARGAASLGPDEAGDAACSTLGELLGLDAAWLLSGSASDLAPSARWVRPGGPAARLGDMRLRGLAESAVGDVSQTSDGRYTVVIVELAADSAFSAYLVGAVRSTQPFPEEDLACAELIGAIHAPGVRLAPKERPRRQPESASSPMILESLAVALASAGSEVDVARAVVNGLMAMIESNSCRFYLLSPAGDRLIAVAHSSVDPAVDRLSGEDFECLIGEGIAGRTFADRTPRVIPNARLDPAAVQIPGTDTVDESMVAVPMLIESEPIGVIVLSRLGAGRFGEDDLRMLNAVASTAAVGCRSARLNQTAREQADVAGALLELGAALAEQGSIKEVARMVATAVDNLVDCAALGVWLGDGVHLRLSAHVGYTPAQVEWLRARRLDTTREPYAEALRRRRLTVLEVDPTAPADMPPASRVVIVPIGEGGGNRGAIVLRRGPRRGAPTARDEQMLLGIADQALLALTNYELYRELDESFLSTVKALANALETKDDYTADHAQALVGLSGEVGVKLGMTGRELRDLSLGAALHDIGKIGIPLEILNKPGPLTEEEWAVMRLHPELGARIIEPVPALAGARELVLACHEHWDGGGYPLGLAGEQIPLGARVILACDAFDALTSDRVYRPAVGRAQAIEEIRRCYGSHFDPRVADALIAVVESAGL